MLSAEVEGGSAQLVPDPDRAHGWSLLLDGAPQSYVDLDDPSHLGFEYQRRLGHVVDLAAPPGRPLHVLHLGGGALSLARYVAATRPRSTQQVVEKDTALSEWIRRELPLERGWRIRVRGGDAREGLGRLPSQWADLVIADVFAGARTPAHLTSTEFLHEVRRVLRTGGIYAANIADGPGSGRGAGVGDGSGDAGDGADPDHRGRRRPLDHLRSQVATVREVFGTAALTADPAVLRGRRFGNAVLAATDGELPVAELSRRSAGDPHPGRVESGDSLAAFTGGAPPVTDATARPSPMPPDDAFK
ncbi:fused MFS/spermidine synthase [Streptomyces sp. HNM0575]|uniref:spermidine synthase n=1 Tax=Streptomyces sp. HNM0575 TaxID=2716338 RepID=UPI0032179E06